MTNHLTYKRLMEPGFIGQVRTRNRILKNGTGFGFQDPSHGFMTQPMLDFYGALARGGVGLIVVGAAHIDFPQSSFANRGFRIDDDKYLPGMRSLTDAVHEHGCPVFQQLLHMGPMHMQSSDGLQPVSASALTKSELPKQQFDVPRELTIPEIQDIVAKFAAGAVRAQKAGFDGIELNAATTHLLNSFLSRAWNKRQDQYGIGNLENRARIIVEIIREVKKAAGAKFAITALINAGEYNLRNGITPEESRVFARLLQDAGADAIHARGEFYRAGRDSTHFPDIHMFPEPPVPLAPHLDGSRHGAGATLPSLIMIKKEISIPLIGVGRFDADLGEGAISRGEIDFVNFNRRLLADLDLPNKIAESRFDDIRPCTFCNTCFGVVELGQPARCRVNAELGRDWEYKTQPAERKKKVMIVGAGPAGLEAARVSALRGHEVSLFDQASRMGGSLPLAAMVKGFEKEEILPWVKYLIDQVRKNGVKVNLGKPVTRTLVEKVKPDVLILATGGKHNIPDIPGVHRKNVLTSKALHARLKFFLNLFSPQFLRFMTRFWMPIGRRVAIIGAGLHGCQTAELLVKRGRRVSIVDTAEEPGYGLVEALVKPYLLTWLKEKGVVTVMGVKFEKITRKALTITRRLGAKESIPADTIITALPLQPDTTLQKEMEGSAAEVYAIGDCKEPAGMIDAVAAGATIARSI
jgi:2,4-dienoyl-CoA reductase (NADPH2)